MCTWDGTGARPGLPSDAQGLHVVACQPRTPAARRLLRHGNGQIAAHQGPSSQSQWRLTLEISHAGQF